MRVLRRVLGAVWAAWKRFAHGVGVVNTHIFLFLAYVVVVGPVSVVLRVLGKDYLRKAHLRTNSYWLDREREEQTLERAKYQF